MTRNRATVNTYNGGFNHPIIARHARKRRGRARRTRVERRGPRSASRIASCQTVPSRRRRRETRRKGKRESLTRPCHARPRSDLAPRESLPSGVVPAKRAGTIAPTILRGYYDFSVRARATPSLAVSLSILPPPRELAHRRPHVQSEVAAACAPAR